MLQQVLFFYFAIGAALVGAALGCGAVQRIHRKIVADKGQGYAIGLTAVTVLYMIVLWPCAVVDAMRRVR